MASITKRISTRVVVDKKTGKEKTVTIERYRARYRDEAGKEHARHFVKKANAQRWLDEVTASVVRGDYVAPAAGKVTFEQWFRRWSEVQDWTDGTAETAAMTLASVPFADVPMSRITQLHVEAWMKGHDEAGTEAKAGARGVDQAHPLQLRPHGLPCGRQGAGDPAGSDGGDHATACRQVGGEDQAPDSRAGRRGAARGTR